MERSFKSKEIIISFIISIIVMSCNKQSKAPQYIETCDDSSVRKYNLNVETLLKSKLYIYFLSDKYKMPFMLKTQSGMDTIPFNRSRLCVSMREVFGFESNRYALSFKNVYKDIPNQNPISFFEISLDSTYQYKNVYYDMAVVPINSFWIDKESLARFKQKVLNDKQSDKWLIENIDKIDLIINESTGPEVNNF